LRKCYLAFRCDLRRNSHHPSLEEHDAAISLIEADKR
jgi:hypothetical protein